MQSTADQAFTKLFSGTNYRITDIIAVRKSGAASVVCAGGIYDAARRRPVMGHAGNWRQCNGQPRGTAVLSGTPYLSLTTGSTAACTCDIFIHGYSID